VCDQTTVCKLCDDETGALVRVTFGRWRLYGVIVFATFNGIGISWPRRVYDQARNRWRMIDTVPPDVLQAAERALRGEGGLA